MSTSLIDAHAGGVGVIESVPKSDADARGNQYVRMRKDIRSV